MTIYKVWFKSSGTRFIKSYPQKFTTPKHTKLLITQLGHRELYTSTSVCITSGSPVGGHFSQCTIRPHAMLLSPQLMTQNGVAANIFSLIETGKQCLTKRRIE